MIGLIRTSLRSGLRRLRSAAFMTLAAAGVAMAAPAIASAAGIDGTPGKCTGKFVNPVTDVCWSCLFRSEEHTSELQSLMRISYAVFCLKKKIIQLSNY